VFVRALALVLSLALPLACAGGEPAPVENARLVDVGSARTYLLVRGADARAPIWLWLHGGPGAAERPLFRHFNGALESTFLVAYWDQRGAGRSYDADANPALLTVERHLGDLDAIVEHLRARFGHRPLVLAGHSWGAALALLYARDHAQKVGALALVAPLISAAESQRREVEFVRTQARQRAERRVSERLRELGEPPYADAERALALERLADRYGAVFHRPPPRARVIVRSLLAGYVTPLEIPRIIRGNQRTLEAMQPELVKLDLTRAVREVAVPVVMVLGRHDGHVDSAIAARYFAALRAPSKRLFWFEESAHNPPFEEPERFNALMQRELASAALAQPPLP
jgi:pimeloyl-ACP methyl ester carboxylesterase